MTQLYKIAQEYMHLAAVLSDEEADQTYAQQTLAALDAAMERKAENIAAIIRNHEVTVEAMKAAESELKVRRQRLEQRVSWCKDYLLHGMETAGIPSISCPYFTIKLRSNPLSVQIDDEAVIPAEYMRQPEPPPPAPDKKKILEDLKHGVVIDGVSLKQTSRVEIK